MSEEPIETDTTSNEKTPTIDDAGVDDQKARGRARAYRYFLKVKDDPDHKWKVKKANGRRYLATKADPEKWKALLKRQADYRRNLKFTNPEQYRKMIDYDNKWKREKRKSFSSGRQKLLEKGRRSNLRQKDDPYYKEVKWHRNHRRQADQRAKLFAIYGSTCTCCGESNQAFLTLDHINNDGRIERKELGRNGYKLYDRAIENPDLKMYQILCYNCNMGKSRNEGVCPHVKALREILSLEEIRRRFGKNA